MPGILARAGKSAIMINRFARGIDDRVLNQAVTLNGTIEEAMAVLAVTLDEQNESKDKPTSALDHTSGHQDESLPSAELSPSSSLPLKAHDWRIGELEDELSQQTRKLEVQLTTRTPHSAAIVCTSTASLAMRCYRSP